MIYNNNNNNNNNEVNKIWRSKGSVLYTLYIPFISAKEKNRLKLSDIMSYVNTVNIGHNGETQDIYRGREATEVNGGVCVCVCVCLCVCVRACV